MTSATVDALRDGTIDAGFQLSGVPSSSWQSLATDHPIRFLGISDERMAELNARLPFYQAELIPAGTYEGQDEDIQTIGVKVVLVTRDDVPPIQGYAMARALVEHNEQLISAHPNGLKWDGRFVADAGFIPFHEGAAAY
jgi:TRAP transporter TAXI family solute receptor